MPVTHIRAAKQPYAAIQYMLTKNGHNGRENRNEFVSFVNMDPDLNPVTQMSRVWQMKRERLKVLGRTCIQSFSRNELDPDNPADVYTAHRIGVETLSELAGTKQAFCVTQKDGKSGLLHNHFFINNVDPITFQGMKGDNKKKGIKCEYSHARLAEISDRVASQYITLDPGLEHGKNRSALERKRELDNESIRRENEDISKWNDQHYYQKNKQRPLKPEKYVWKDDIRESIEMCAHAVKSWDEFTKKLPSYGVDVKEGKNGKYVTYSLQSTERYKISAWNEAKADIAKQNEERKQNGEEPLPQPRIDDFEPKHKLSARDRSLGKRYSKEGVTEIILGIDPEEQAAKEAARAAEAESMRQARAALDAHKDAIAEEEQFEEEYDRHRKEAVQYEHGESAESTEEKSGVEEKTVDETVKESVESKPADGKSDKTEPVETEQQTESVQRRRPRINIFRRKQPSATPAKDTEEDPDDIEPKEGEVMIPVIGEGHPDDAGNRKILLEIEEKQRRERQKRNQNEYWNVRKKQDDHTDLSEIFNDYRKMAEKHKEDDDQYGE